ncbi:MAG: CPBP family intramembrane metalloprotease [Acetatifactor sp.]|nr:CPBP family intramembrane metalloprotease [Acetatifactor sp.]
MKNIVLNLLPFNNRKDMTAPEYVIKKLLAVVLIYVASVIIGEAVIIGALSGMGFDVMNGEMPPEGIVTWLLSYFEYGIYILLTLLYCKLIEKEAPKSMLRWKVSDYLAGTLLAVGLLGVILCGCCATGSISFLGAGAGVNVSRLLLILPGIALQAASEEVLCRGFLLAALKKKISDPAAVFISSTVFALPHFLGMLSCEPKFFIVGVINLYLISIFFSLLTLRRGSIWMACGLHFAWNYMLNCVMGLTVSGNESLTDGPLAFVVNGDNLLSGGAYGIEASILTTIVTALSLAGMFAIRRKKG